MLFGEMIAFYHRDHLKPRGLYCGKNSVLFDIMGGGYTNYPGGLLRYEIFNTMSPCCYRSTFEILVGTAICS